MVDLATKPGAGGAGLAGLRFRVAGIAAVLRGRPELAALAGAPVAPPRVTGA